ncbi:hypothetical protein A0H81_08356 [Grifola frondosa]|uniref:Uncharacterized protein n=1 Tax=Grifola frondosa TaxID=5627 RepID=A0A1C7M2V6_GRIFR|nr:hypothetical protein A0H81_08356 [Grifola frondosa]
MGWVTPENIAYVCVLARFILNDQREWHLDDGNFKGQDFYDLIVDSFKDDEDQIFGITDDKESSDKVEEDNEWTQMVAQRAARHAQALAAILTSPTCSPSPADDADSIGAAGNHGGISGEGSGERFKPRRRQDEDGYEDEDRHEDEDRVWDRDDNGPPKKTGPLDDLPEHF